MKDEHSVKEKLIYSGKAKDIYSTSHPDEVVAVYKDQVTALNGGRKEQMTGKGRLNNLITSLIFEKLNEAGFKTHFIRQLSDTEQLNRRLYIIPLEVVLRNVAAGSFSKRFGIDEGVVCKQPLIEFYYKKDELDDPFINDEHVLFFEIASQDEIAYIKQETHRINVFLKELFANIGLTLVDFKLEFGRCENGEILLADEFSPDNCRLWDADGNHLDKDVFRRNLGQLTDVYELVLEKLMDME